jgi:hypothetical protein
VDRIRSARPRRGVHRRPPEGRDDVHAAEHDRARLGLRPSDTARRRLRRARPRRLEHERCLDRRRVFATGMSNGGFFANLLGCRLADRLPRSLAGRGSPCRSRAALRPTLRGPPRARPPTALSAPRRPRPHAWWTRADRCRHVDRARRLRSTTRAARPTSSTARARRRIAGRAMRQHASGDSFRPSPGGVYRTSRSHLAQSAACSRPHPHSTPGAYTAHTHPRNTEHTTPQARVSHLDSPYKRLSLYIHTQPSPTKARPRTINNTTPSKKPNTEGVAQCVRSE